MLELIQITNDPAFARRCDALEGMRLFVDLERLGKAERQAGRNTFISAPPARTTSAASSACCDARRLMVRVNPAERGHAERGRRRAGAGRRPADAADVPPRRRSCASSRAGGRPRAHRRACWKRAAALDTLDDWIDTPGLQRGVRRPERPAPVAGPALHVRAAGRRAWSIGSPQAARARGLRFGFGGIARLDEGLLPGRDVLAEHLRLGSRRRDPVAHLPSRRRRRGRSSDEVRGAARGRSASWRGARPQQVQADARAHRRRHPRRSRRGLARARMKRVFDVCCRAARAGAAVAAAAGGGAGGGAGERPAGAVPAAARGPGRADVRHATSSAAWSRTPRRIGPYSHGRRRPAHHPRRAASCAAPASTNCRSC